MRRSGHFEFGLDRRPVNLGDGAKVRRIQETLARGDDALGLAIYWDMVYGYLWRLLEHDPAIQRASLVVRFEDIATEPEQTLRRALRHCKLPEADVVAGRHAARMRRPTSDPGAFSPRELAAIRDVTATTARLWGYDSEK